MTTNITVNTENVDANANAATTATTATSSNGKSKQRRQKLKKQTTYGEEFGLVPQKYLLRKTATTPRSTQSENQDEENSLRPFMDESKNDDTAVVLPRAEREKRLREFSAALARKHIGNLRMENDAPFVKEWKMQVLRAEGYNVPRAVSRAMMHWRIKSELFGTPDLRLSLSDLSPSLLASGLIQLVPARDLAGRAVVCVDFRPDVYSKQEREFRKYLFYMMASALEDESTQDHGVVLVVWNSHPRAMSSPWGSLFDAFWNLWKSIKNAFWNSRLHYCMVRSDHGLPASNSFDSIGSNTSASPYSLKESQETFGSGREGTATTLVRQHEGSPHECLHGLLTFGVPVPALFVWPPKDDQLPPQESENTPEGETSWEEMGAQSDYYNKWLQWRKQTESYLPPGATSPSRRNAAGSKITNGFTSWKLILVPDRQDILFGKNVSSVNGGNILFHQMLSVFVDQYRTAGMMQRRTIRKEIYESLCQTTTTTNAPPAKTFDDEPDQGESAFENPTEVETSGGRQWLQAVEPTMGIMWEPMEESAIDAKIGRALDYVMESTTPNSTDRNTNSAVQNVTDMWEFGDLLLQSRKCFQVLTCQEGHHICDSNNMGAFWQNQA